MHTLDLRWVLPAVAILCVEYLMALLIGARIGFAYQIPFGVFAVTGATIAAFGLTVALLWHLFLLWREGEQHPGRRILARLPWSFGVGVMLVSCQIAALNWTKIMMPLAVGFWADPALAAFDDFMFGQDSWRLSHQIFGDFTPLIDRLYGLWAPIKFACLVALLCLPASPRKAQVLVAYFLTMACGALGQYLGASAGPIFYEAMELGDRFKDLPVGPWAAAARDYLWNDHVTGGGHVGTGISAMPSMHVAIALWMALVGRAFLPRLQLLGWAYFAVVLVGSVHLGWHYASDGIVASAFVSLAWTIAGVVASPGWGANTRRRAPAG